MAEVRAVLARLGLSEYADRLIANGFSTWKDLQQVTEDDLERVEMKRGHRRKLQREIASALGLPFHEALSEADN